MLLNPNHLLFFPNSQVGMLLLSFLYKNKSVSFKNKKPRYYTSDCISYLKLNYVITLSFFINSIFIFRQKNWQNFFESRGGDDDDVDASFCKMYQKVWGRNFLSFHFSFQKNNKSIKTFRFYRQAPLPSILRHRDSSSLDRVASLWFSIGSACIGWWRRRWCQCVTGCSSRWTRRSEWTTSSSWSSKTMTSEQLWRCCRSLMTSPSKPTWPRATFSVRRRLMSSWCRHRSCCFCQRRQTSWPPTTCRGLSSCSSCTWRPVSIWRSRCSCCRHESFCFWRLLLTAWTTADDATLTS